MKRFGILMLVVIVGIVIWGYVPKSFEAGGEVIDGKAWGFEAITPKAWELVEAPENTLTLEYWVARPTEKALKLSNLGEVNVGVIAVSEGFLANSEQFELWLATPSGTISEQAVEKLGEVGFGDMKGVLLTEAASWEVYGSDEYFVLTAWVVRDGKNYYVQGLGKGVLGDAEEVFLREFLKSWKWVN